MPTSKILTLCIRKVTFVNSFGNSVRIIITGTEQSLAAPEKCYLRCLVHTCNIMVVFQNSHSIYFPCTHLYKVKKSLCLSISPWKCMGEWIYCSTYSLRRHSMEMSGSVSRPASKSVWPLRNKMPLPRIVLRFLGRSVMFVSLFDILPYDCATRHSESQIALWGITYAHRRRKCQCGLVWRKVAQAASYWKVER